MPDFLEPIPGDETSSRNRQRARKPSWSLTSSARYGLFMGILFCGLAIATLIASFGYTPSTVLAVGFLVQGVWWLISAAAARRYKQHTQQPPSSHDAPAG